MARRAKAGVRQIRAARGNGRGGFLSGRSLIGTGWNTMAAVFPMRDFTGDGRMDIGAVNTAGTLFVLPGTGTGRLQKSRVVGTGWQVYF